MPTPAPKANPVEELAREISNLKSKLQDLQKQARLSSVRDTVEDLQTNINGLPGRIAGLRSRGYVFESHLETNAAGLGAQWQAVRPQVMSQIERQSSELQAGLRPLEAQMTQLAGQANNPLMGRNTAKSLEAGLETLESKAKAAESSIRGMYDQVENGYSALNRDLSQIDWSLTELAEATFQLLATEGLIRAVKAVWCKTGKETKEDPEGVLYLTDQRLIFEQKQEVATKKVLFITTEKKKIQGLQLEAPVALVETVETSRAGLLKNEDHIDVRFASGGPVSSAHFHIWQSCDAWQALINRAKTRDFDKGRAVAIDQAAAEKVKSAPSQCPSCGGNIKQQVLRGMDTITCEYCGFVIRL